MRTSRDFLKFDIAILAIYIAYYIYATTSVNRLYQGSSASTIQEFLFITMLIPVVF
jgi:hypothetical protein